MPTLVAQFHESLIDHLVTVMGGLTRAVTVGDGEVSVDGTPTDPPYIVAYPLSSTRQEGDLADVTGSPTLPYQCTCVGASTLEVLWIADELRAALDTWTPSGYNVTVLHSDYGAALPDFDVSPTVFYCTPEASFVTSAA